MRTTKSRRWPGTAVRGLAPWKSPRYRTVWSTCLIRPAPQQHNRHWLLEDLRSGYGSAGRLPSHARAAPGQGVRVKFRMPAIDIRPATESDAAVILRFITELATYERAQQEVVATEADLRATLFGGGPARALICSVDAVEAGFAVYFFNYSTWQGRKGLYLEDLYVTPARRQIGVGKAMLQHLARLAVAEGCGRFEWSVLDWNEPALQFYRSSGASPLKEWVRYRLAGAALAKLAGAAQSPG